MTIELPEPTSRDAEMWRDLFLGVFIAEFPFARQTAEVRCQAMMDAFLRKLEAYYGLANSR